MSCQKLRDCFVYDKAFRRKMLREFVEWTNQTEAYKHLSLDIGKVLQMRDQHDTATQNC